MFSTLFKYGVKYLNSVYTQLLEHFRQMRMIEKLRKTKPKYSNIHFLKVSQANTKDARSLCYLYILTHHIACLQICKCCNVAIARFVLTRLRVCNSAILETRLSVCKFRYKRLHLWSMIVFMYLRSFDSVFWYPQLETFIFVCTSDVSIITKGNQNKMAKHSFL